MPEAGTSAALIRISSPHVQRYAAIAPSASVDALPSAVIGVPTGPV
jgi:hypothetical protein